MHRKELINTARRFFVAKANGHVARPASNVEQQVGNKRAITRMRVYSTNLHKQIYICVM